MRSLHDLTREYDDMNTRNSAAILVTRPGLASSNSETSYCLAISTFGGWNLHTPAWQNLMAWLAPLSNVGILYHPHPTSHTHGRLHWTLQQCQPFSEEMDISKNNLENLTPILESLAGLTIQYVGLVLTPTGIALRGIPATERDYQRILQARDSLKDVLPLSNITYNPPYINTICHSTIFRWTKEPTSELHTYVRNGIHTWKETLIATLRPYTYDIGYMTLRCRVSDNVILRRYHVPLRIAHRGLLHGPDSSLENRITTFEYNIKHNIVSECDIWYCDGAYMLGHDRPEEPVDLQWLISNKEWLLIHTKNLETFWKLKQLREEEGIDVHYFYHTDEDIVLTSRGWVIVYPGKPVHDGWIAMMPERAPHIPTTTAYAICSDYMYS